MIIRHNYILFTQFGYIVVALYSNVYRFRVNSEGICTVQSMLCLEIDDSLIYKACLAQYRRII